MRVEETVGRLIDRMLADDPEATREVGRRLAAGDPHVAYELRKRAATAASGETTDDPDSFQVELLMVKDLTTSGPGTTGQWIEDLEVRARRLGRCQVVQVLGLSARRLTLIGDLAAARETLGRARAEAGDCQACILDTLRREALLLLHLGDKAGALTKSQGAMDGYEALGGPGHDLNGDGWASSLIARAQIRFELGDRAGAAADFAIALEHFPRPSKIWRVTHQNLSHTLTLSGPVERSLASKDLVSLRLRMRKGVTVERAGFLWMDGQLVISIGERRYLGMDRLIASLRLYRHPKIATPGPWLGVASDYSRALYPQREKIARFLEREVTPYSDRLIKSDVHREQLRKLYALCEARRSTPATWPALRRVIESLRAAAGDAMPCLLPPWPVSHPTAGL
jgi:hypothetical protein